MSRRTYRYDETTKRMVEVTRTRGSTGLALLMNDRHYSDKPFTAPDGTIINSRKKHQAYMKRTGLTVAGDFTNQWKSDAKKRERYFTGENHPDREERRQIIARAMEQHRGR